MELKDLPKLQEELNKTLELVLELHTATLPEIKKTVTDLTNGVKDGFNTSILTEQARRSVNNGINQSDVGQLKDKVKEATEHLLHAISSAQRSATSFSKKSNLYAIIWSSSASFLLGIAIAWGCMFSHSINKLDKYQCAISMSNRYADFINKSCEMKKSFARFEGQKEFDCEKQWESAAALIKD